MSADNQQESLDAKWIVGFTDAEGCFYVGINEMPKMTLGWQVLPEFRIVQHERDEELLREIRNYFGFGGIKKNHRNRKDYRVRGLENLDKVVKFFEQHQLKTKKKQDFEIFSEIIDLMNEDKHLGKSGLDKIALLASHMNEQTSSSYLESSETVRQTSSHR